MVETEFYLFNYFQMEVEDRENNVAKDIGYQEYLLT
jgi:hypothetical protein